MKSGSIDDEEEGSEEVEGGKSVGEAVTDKDSCSASEGGRKFSISSDEITAFSA